MENLKNINNCIYAFINIENSKIYIGQASNMYRRYYEHKKMRDKGTSLLHRAFKKYGFNNFKLIILEKDIDDGCISKRESFYIKNFDATNKEKGYNICPTGFSTKGRKRPSQEMEGIKKHLKSLVGDKNYFYGKTHSEESIAKMRKVKLGKKWTPEQRDKYLKSIQKREHPCNYKKIIQKNKSGKIIKVWDTITLASNSLHISKSDIVMVANKTPMRRNGKIYTRKSAGGYLWEYY